MSKKLTKAALLAHKKQLLDEIQYSQKSIDDLRAKLQKQIYYEEPDSSDSEDYLADALDKGPHLQTLKHQHSKLQICQHAAQELTGLTVLQYEINVLVEEPEFEGELPIKEPGTWREVTAECRIDLVPFTITFLTHTGLKTFAATSYRCLKTCLVKSSHEIELNNSVLQTVRSPSDAVQVIRSYAAAHRSRRTTLAHLANKYANSIIMEPHPEGGFVLKCANLLEILWRLETKSPLSPFHHRMKTVLEYMDDAYVKVITQANKELSDPSLQTDERTLLLAKIITTCLEVKGTMDSESDLDSVGIVSKNTDNQKDSIEKDNEVMAPPKKLPKKTKTGIKDTIKSKNAQKRAIEDVNMGENTKKIKSTEVNGIKNVKNKEKRVDAKVTDNVSTNVIEENLEKIKSSEVNGNKNTKNKEKNAEYKIIDKENNIKNKEVLKKKSNEKLDAKKSQSNNNANSKTKNPDDVQLMNNIDNNKKINKENANKRTRNDQTENINIDSQKHKNSKTKTMVENIEKPGKEMNKNDKVTKNSKKHKCDEVINENEVNTNINNIEIRNNNKNDNNHAKKAKMAITNDNSEKNNIKNDALKSKSDKNDRISSNNKNFDENNEKSDVPSIDKNAKTSITNEKRNKNEIPSKTIEKNAKILNLKNKNDILAKKIDKKNKMALVNDKKFDVITKKIADVHNKNKNNKNNDENTANKETRPEKDVEKVTPDTNNTNSKSTKIVKNKITGNTASQTSKKTIEKNYKTNKDSVARINKQQENKKINPNKTITTKGTVNNKKISKMNTKTIKDIIRNSPLHKNPLKLQNAFKTGNTKTQTSTKMFSGNTEKKNSENNSKIPQKKILNENNFKNNMLRMSPRNLSSKFKTVSMSKEMVKKMVNTNIPRLMKKPVPRSSK